MSILMDRLVVDGKDEQIERQSVPSLDGILGRRFRCLDQGFVRLVDYMGSEAAVVQAARVSYGKGTKTVREDAQLLHYLYEHEHTTPIEMVKLKFHVRIPMDAWRQGVRQRMSNVNEYSTRYSEAIDARQQTGPEDWRLQSSLNKQGSAEGVVDWPEPYKQQTADTYDTESKAYLGKTPIVDVYGSAGEYLTAREAELHRLSQEVYEERLKFGIAKEQARKDLPLSTYTELYWCFDLHNLLKFLAKRMHPTAQKEIRDYADVIGAIVEVGYPNVWQAHCNFDVHKGAIKLSSLEQHALWTVLSRPTGMSIEEWCRSEESGIAKSLGERRVVAFVEKAKTLIPGEKFPKL